MIDRQKVRAVARRLDDTGRFVLLDRAIDLLPDEAFPELVAKYVHLHDIVAADETTPDLLDEIRRFHRESLDGRYYQDFMVNSRNCTEKSRETQAFISDHRRLLDACLRAERSEDLDTAREGLGMLIDLMREIDRFEIDIVFFADEAGSWQVGVLWDEVLPAWFRCLSPTCAPDEWAKAVVDALNDFAGYQTNAILTAARGIGTPEQRQALTAREGDLRRR